MHRLLLACLLLLSGAAASAEVVDKSPAGFTTKTTVAIAAPPAQVYAMLARVGEWWDPAHTYSGDAKRMTIERTQAMATIASVTISGPHSVTGPGDSPSRRRIFVCRPASPADEVPCARRILSALARRAYRRPAAATDLQDLLQ